MNYTYQPDDLVLLERMPDWLRGSHRAAGNWGRYPLNGAERIITSRESAAEQCAADPDEYDHIVRDASPADLEQYTAEP